jgi:hypothetical protein
MAGRAAYVPCIAAVVVPVPTLLFAALLGTSGVAWSHNSPSALPALTMVLLLGLWVLVGVPSACIGAALAHCCAPKGPVVRAVGLHPLFFRDVSRPWHYAGHIVGV